MSKMQVLQEYVNKAIAEKAVPKLGLTSVTQMQGQNYDIIRLIKDGSTNHCKIFKELVANFSNLHEGYVIALSYNREAIEERKANTMMVREIKIGNKSFIISKAFGIASELEPDFMTPNRFNMLLTLAAAAMYNKYMEEAKRGNTKPFLEFANNARQKITNPIALQHGFVCDGNITDINSRDAKMVFYYLCMTIGFDALAHTYPTKAIAIAAYRAWGKNPITLGLTNGLEVDPSDFVDNETYCGKNIEVIKRIQQGIMTKTFKFKTADDDEVKDYKVNEIQNNVYFASLIVKHSRFLINEAKPSKTRDKRHENLEGFLASIINEETMFGDDEVKPERLEQLMKEKPKSRDKSKERIMEKAAMEGISRLLSGKGLAIGLDIPKSKKDSTKLSKVTLPSVSSKMTKKGQGETATKITKSKEGKDSKIVMPKFKHGPILPIIDGKRLTRKPKAVDTRDYQLPSDYNLDVDQAGIKMYLNDFFKLSKVKFDDAIINGILQFEAAFNIHGLSNFQIIDSELGIQIAYEKFEDFNDDAVEHTAIEDLVAEKLTNIMDALVAEDTGFLDSMDQKLCEIYLNKMRKDLGKQFDQVFQDFASTYLSVRQNAMKHEAERLSRDKKKQQSVAGKTSSKSTPPPDDEDESFDQSLLHISGINEAENKEEANGTTNISELLQSTGLDLLNEESQEGGNQADDESVEDSVDEKEAKEKGNKASYLQQLLTSTGVIEKDDEKKQGQDKTKEGVGVDKTARGRKSRETKVAEGVKFFEKHRSKSQPRKDKKGSGEAEKARKLAEMGIDIKDPETKPEGETGEPGGAPEGVSIDVVVENSD